MDNIAYTSCVVLTFVVSSHSFIFNYPLGRGMEMMSGGAICPFFMVL